MSQLDPLPINPSVTRVLLTYIRAAKYVDQSELEQKLCVICDELGVPPASLDEVVHHLNHTISFSGFKIDRCLDEVSNTLVYAFVNSSSISTQVDKTLSRFKLGELTSHQASRFQDIQRASRVDF
ncbi:hypothetical protein CANTEDRAFT_92533 [Yamadazyma tenuis ATCC 10573]|uniref:Non-structural maintenance of chromosomes element 1 homolog n=1 Tax=Candida tenuis (strain ATCC 10573 / BCRC 21748 / CBS 615 / JCM 9827 / NBRC 10315 / NRRL Y-1498 / VKM Y-70) TaxID=590646 RepID=G3B042_CANTC|nr:uncharacterized protein CANTEDRAFT_92533 [Yamadazyma tenuis ATCC 10573]EGV65311.1 hypothetical protein CANTEDRAFT_92533 [Yamadazyma tenuis ATCC 10573]